MWTKTFGKSHTIYIPFKDKLDPTLALWNKIEWTSCMKVVDHSRPQAFLGEIVVQICKIF